jgi:hypothetical protein
MSKCPGKVPLLAPAKPRISDDFTQGFQSAGVILPVMNETWALQTTIDILESEVEIVEYLLITCERTFEASVRLCQELCARDASRFKCLEQSLPFLGGAIREGFARAKSSHVVMMASDLETDPHTVRSLVELSKQHPAAIVTASRWLRGAEFEGYNRFKLAANYLFQKLFSRLYGVRLTDMTYGFRIFPTALVRQIKWQELKHPFLFETLVKPLRLGVPVLEVPSRWRARTEGVSQNSFWDNFAYWRVGLVGRFLPKEKIL